LYGYEKKAVPYQQKTVPHPSQFSIQEQQKELDREFVRLRAKQDQIDKQKQEFEKDISDLTRADFKQE
jgi:hypothetical protein